MSDILLKWLAEDVGLHVNNIEKDFADGYRFGQLFSQFNLQPDMPHFNAKRTPDAMVNNYTRLQDTFAKLGIPMDSRTAGSLMREEAGVAKRLLYDIKRSVGGLDKDLQKSQRSGKLGRELGASLATSKVFLEAQKYNSQTEKYDTTKARFFEDIMRARSDNPNALLESVHLRKFTDAGDKNAARAANGDARDTAKRAEESAALRRSLIDTLDNARHDKAKKLEHDEAVHAVILKHKEDIESQELRVELALSEKAKRKRLQEIRHASLDVAHGIDAFETNMKRMTGGEDGEAPLVPPAHAGAGDHMAHLRALAAAPGDLLKGTHQYMTDVRAHRKDEVANRKEREARRRRLIVEQQHHAAETERKVQAESLVAALARQSAEEQRVAARLWQLGREKEVMKEGRELREQQYATRREKDWEETLHRELELHRSLREQYEQEALLESEAWSATQVLRSAQKTAKHEALARGIAWQLVMLAERAIQYRATTNVLVPKHEYRKWIAMFTADDPKLGTPVADPDEVVEDALAPDLVAGRATTHEYLHCSGAFDGLVPEPIAPHDRVGKIVSDLASVVRERTAPEGQPGLQSMLLRLAVVGAPCAGKSSTAQHLARKFRLRLLDPETLLAEAIAAAAQYDASAAVPAAPADTPAQVPAAADEAAALAEKAAHAVGDVAAPEAPLEAPAAAEVPPKVVLGRLVKPLLEEGRVIEDTILVQLMVIGIQEAQTWVYVPETERDAKGNPKPKKPLPKGAIPEETNAQGFVLDGFPRTVTQAQMLEVALTGLDLAGEQAVLDSASLLAPPPPDALPVLERPRTSGLDAVLVLGLSDDAVALKRALGRRLDPTTGRIYHLEFDPPPANEPGLSARLVEVQDSSNDAHQIQQRLSLYGTEAAPLDDWLRRFIKLRRPTDGTAAIAVVQTTASDIASSILRAKAAAHSAECAAQAAQKARASAEKAQEFAELAMAHAESAARGMLAAKKAEIAASAMLVAVPKNSKEALKESDIAANEVLKAQAAAKCAESLKVCKGAATDAEGYATRAAECAATASQEAEKAAKSLGDAEINAQAETTATAAAEDAEVASVAAAAAADKAETAKVAADVALAEAEKWMAATDVPPDAKVELAAPPAVESADVDASTAGANAFAAAEPPNELAGVLLDEWTTLESEYFAALATGFGSLHSQHAAVVGHIARVRQAFLRLLHRPDAKPAMVSRFQKEFNAFDVDSRPLKETQAELILRGEELRESLWALVDKKAEEAEAERARLAGDSFVADHVTLVAQSYNSLMQTEVDRFYATVNFLKGHGASRLAAAFPDGDGVSSTADPNSGASGTPAANTGRASPAPTSAHARGASAAAPSTSGGPAAGELIPPDLSSTTVPLDIKDKIEEKSKTAMVFPPHVLALSSKPPSAALGLALKVALASAARTIALMEPPPPDPKKAKREDGGASTPAKGTKPKKGEEPVPDSVLSYQAAQEAMAADLLVAARRELATLESRLEVLAVRAVSQLEELHLLSGQTHEQLGTWTKERCKAESSAVAALDRIIKDAAYSGKPLQQDLVLDDITLIVDEGIVHLLPPPPLPTAAPRERQPPAGLLSTAQMQALAVAFRNVSPNGFVKLNEAAELLCHMAGQGQLPDGWRAASSLQMLSALGCYDPVFSGYLDWREVLVSLIGAAFPVVFKIEGPEMVDQVDMCREADKLTTGRVGREAWDGLDLWFQYKAPTPGSAGDIEAEFAVPVASPAAKPEFDSLKGLKDALWEIFSAPEVSEGGESGSPTMDYMTMLLYLCADRDLFTGIKKAVNVVTHSLDANPSATAAHLFQIAYPQGMEAGVDIHRSPIDLHALQGAVSAAQAGPPPGTAGGTKSKPPTRPATAEIITEGDAAETALITAEQLMYSVHGERIVSHLLGRYQWKDLYTATRLRDE